LDLLIYTPTWLDDNGQEAVHPQVRAMIEAQRPAGVCWEWQVDVHNPFPVTKPDGRPEYRNVLAKYQRIRETFLAGTWDALLTIEHDNLLPDEDAVQRLVETPGDIVYAPYLFRSKHMMNICRPRNKYEKITWLDKHPDELTRAREAVIWPCSGVGFGCTLIYRKVLQQTAFKPNSDANACPDVHFADKCVREGFQANARMDVPVKHWNGSEWLSPW
jgi:hypothetical protein